MEEAAPDRPGDQHPPLPDETPEPDETPPPERTPAPDAPEPPDDEAPDEEAPDKPDQPDEPENPEPDRERCRQLRLQLRIEQGKLETAQKEVKGLSVELDDVQERITQAERDLTSLWNAYLAEQLAVAAFEVAIELGLWLLSRHPLGRVAVVVGRGVALLRRRADEAKKEPQQPKPSPDTSAGDAEIRSLSGELEGLYVQRSELTTQVVELNDEIARAYAAIDAVKRKIQEDCSDFSNT